MADPAHLTAHTLYFQGFTHYRMRPLPLYIYFYPLGITSSPIVFAIFQKG